MKNKAKVKVAELTGVQQLHKRLHLACAVCLWTQSQPSLYSISLSVKRSANKALYMEGVTPQESALSQELHGGCVHTAACHL